MRWPWQGSKLAVGLITHKLEPDSLSRAELDQFLERGWYRIGRAMITTDYLVNEGKLRSTIWTRADLRAHQWKPSLRKLMARNGRRFRVEVGPLRLDDAHEALYQRYRAMLGGARMETLDGVLGGEEGRRLFDTREVSIYLNDALVAFSWFDVGETSVESLIGVYDPDHRKHGLGFYTMLVEMAYAAEQGMRFHYSGYVLSEPSNLDYKRRVGPLDYLDPTSGRWLPELPFPQGESPAEILRRRLGDAARELSEVGLPVLCVYNSALQIPGVRERIPACTVEPILLVCASPGRSSGILVTWSQARMRYVLFGGAPLHFVTRNEEEDEQPSHIHLFAVHQELSEHETVPEVVSQVGAYLQLIELAHEAG